MSSLFEDALDIPAWLEDDRARSYGDRVHRDRRIGLAIGQARPLDRVRRWWRELETDGRPDLGARFNRSRGWVALLVGILGAASGSGLTLLVLRYDGAYPVNVVAALAVLVVLPVFFLIASLLLMPGRLPGLRGLQDLVAAINVGNFAAAIASRDLRSQGGVRLDWRGAPTAGLARPARWQILVFSQIAGLAFSVAAVASALALVVFTDLAFGWSTTLDVSARQAHRLVEFLAWPWASWLPDAVPAPNLVEESRYFRLADGDTTVGDANRLTGWWPFLLMSLVVYGVLPRAALLAFASARLRAALRHTLLTDPGVRGLCDRMDSAVLDAEGEGCEPPAAPWPSDAADAVVRITDPVRIIAWDLAGDVASVHRWIASHVHDAQGSPIFVGGDNVLDEDDDALISLNPNDRTRVLMLVKGWEPPLLDCLDLLGTLRSRLDRDVSIMVVPLGLEDGAPAPHEADAWRHAIATLADPGTYLEVLADEPRPGSADADP